MYYIKYEKIFTDKQRIHKNVRLLFHKLNNLNRFRFPPVSPPYRGVEKEEEREEEEESEEREERGSSEEEVTQFIFELFKTKYEGAIYEDGDVLRVYNDIEDFRISRFHIRTLAFEVEGLLGGNPYVDSKGYEYTDMFDDSMTEMIYPWYIDDNIEYGFIIDGEHDDN